MAQIGLNISVSGLSGYLIIRWIKASAPLAEVGRNDNPSTFTFPYDDVYVIIDLQPVVYIVQLWRSDDGSSLDQLIKDWSIDASKFTETTIATYQYVVDRGQSGSTPAWADPVNGDTVLNDARLDGFTKDQMIVHEAGYGNKLDSEYNLVSGGGIELLGGKTFDSGVAWFITVASLNEIAAQPTASAPMFTGLQILTSDQDFDNITTPLMNKLCIANWAGTVGTITFPDLSLIADDVHVTFQTHGGNQNYLKLQFDAGDTVRFMNQDVNVIYLARCEKISLYFKSGVCYVIDYDGNACRRGSVLQDYDSNRDSDLRCLLYADEATGVLNKNDYPGLYEFVNQLSGTSVCSLGTSVGQWSYDSGGGVYPNKRKFGIDTGAQTFRVPHLSGMSAKMYSTPGVYESDAVGPMSLEIRDGSGGSATGTMVNTGFSGQDNPAGWISNGAPGAEKYIRPAAGSPTETRVRSVLQKPYIYL